MAEGAPFENERDLKVMWNDWPYGVDPRIVHLVVWTKFAFEDDAVTGDLTDRQRMQIDRYVEREFRVRCGAHNVSLPILCKGRAKAQRKLIGGIGYLVPQLGGSEECACRGAFSCYALRSGP